MRLFIILTIMLALDGCSADSSSGSEHLTKIPEERYTISTSSISLDTSRVKSWLTNLIVDYTTNNDLKAAYKNMRSSLTDNYYNYKQDAINLEYDTTMTEEQFHQKWKLRYDTKFVGKGGFFISTQDNGKIAVPVCRLLSSIGDTALVYHVIIRDLDFKTDFTRDITVVARDKQYFVDDVKEFE